MNTVRERKKDFIENAFCNAIKVANPDVDNLRYNVADNSEELVTVAYRNGHARLINVTADSYNAMMRDVLAHLD